MKKKAYVYKITSPSGNVYIGKTVNLTNRLNKYKCFDCERQKILCRSLKKYGFENHNFEIIYEGEITNLDLNNLEIYYIGFYNSYNEKNKNGMNLTLGGDGWFGREHSEETKNKISESRKKTGKTERHQKAIENLKGRKIIKSDEWIKNNSESIKKPILQFDLDGNLIKEWNSAKDVEIELGLCRKNISANLRNKTKHAYGYKWIFKQN